MEKFDRTSFAAPSFTGIIEGPVKITCPRSLVARLNALAVSEDAFGAFKLPSRGTPQDLGELRLTEDDALLHDAGTAAWDRHDDSLGDADAFAAGTLLDPVASWVAPQVHVQALVREFYRRQRQATLLVAGSLAAAFLLTLGGVVLVTNFTAPRPANGDNRPPSRSTSIAWQRPDGYGAPARLELAAMTANHTAKGEPMLIPAVARASASPSSEAAAAQVILATSGRPLALAPLLPRSHARYLLLRGLPPGAELSAGRRSRIGTWFVKDAEVSDLTLSIGAAASGDYPLEIYVLDSGNAPQSRRSLVLRVEAAQTFGPDVSWAAALLDVPFRPHTAEEPVLPAQSAVLLERAKRLLDEGDIAAARLLLRHLAERGQSDAAYELARTFDQDTLSALGARGMGADPARAQRWYEQASQKGNAKAAERLKTLASLSGSGPSD
jgi:TPR repeat protein